MFILKCSTNLQIIQDIITSQMNMVEYQYVSRLTFATEVNSPVSFDQCFDIWESFHGRMSKSQIGSTSRKYDEELENQTRLTCKLKFD